MSELVEREHQYYMQVARRQPVVIVKGEGSWVWDEAGEEYLDFHAGWAVDTPVSYTHLTLPTICSV